MDYNLIRYESYMKKIKKRVSASIFFMVVLPLLPMCTVLLIGARFSYVNLLGYFIGLIAYPVMLFPLISAILCSLPLKSYSRLLKNCLKDRELISIKKVSELRGFFIIVFIVSSVLNLFCILLHMPSIISDIALFCFLSSIIGSIFAFRAF